mgnify:CR=1 FL=1
MPARGRSGQQALGAGGLHGGAAIRTAQAVAIFLADMPQIRRDSLDTLLAQADAERILLPSYRGSRGHPVLFGRRFWPQLAALSGDTGAKSVIQQHPGAVRIVELDDPGLVLDVDTAEDWRRL